MFIIIRNVHCLFHQCIWPHHAAGFVLDLALVNRPPFSKFGPRPDSFITISCTEGGLLSFTGGTESICIAITCSSEEFSFLLLSTRPWLGVVFCSFKIGGAGAGAGAGDDSSAASSSFSLEDILEAGEEVSPSLARGVVTAFRFGVVGFWTMVLWGGAYNMKIKLLNNGSNTWVHQ